MPQSFPHLHARWVAQELLAKIIEPEILGENKLLSLNCQWMSFIFLKKQIFLLIFEEDTNIKWISSTPAKTQPKNQHQKMA